MFGVGATAGPKGTADDAIHTQVRDLGTVLLGLVAYANLIEPGVRVRFAQRAQREFAAVEAAALAELKTAGATDRDVQRRAAAGGTRSRKESSKRTKRADAVKENPTLAKKLGDGSLGEEHVDAIARASAESGGDAAKDETLIREIEESKPDDAHKITNKWLERRNEDSAQSRYDRQRSRRKAIKGRSLTSGTATIELHGSDEDQAEMWQRIEQRAHEMYVADGGRDVPDDEHPRTHQQRLFDAAYELIMQQPAAGRVATNADESAADQHEQLDQCDSGGNDGEGSASPGSTRSSEPASQARQRAPHPRSLIHVTLTVDDDAEQSIRAACPNGQGYLPESVLERYACGSMLGGTVFNQRGEILWYGRKIRYASPAQYEALVARDGGCVLCGADASRCEVHHLDPFNAPVAGETNVDKMVLVCSPCHHWLHDHKRTLYRILAPPGDIDNAGPEADHPVTQRSKPSAKRRPDRQSARPDQQKRNNPSRNSDALPGTLAAQKPTWHTRPATPDEIAPPRRPNPPNPDMAKTRPVAGSVREWATPQPR